MKKTKGLIILLVVLGVYGLVLFFAFGNKENNDNNNNNNTNTQTNNVDTENKYLVIDNDNIYKYNNNTFSSARVYEIEKVEKFKVYVNDKYYGDYKLKNAGNWNLFDGKDEYVNYNGNLLAFSDNFNIKVRNNYKIREINENDKVLLINNYNLNSFSNLITKEVIDIDLDNNDVMDEIICLSAMDEDNSKNNYNIFMIKLNDEKMTVIEEKEDNAKYVYSIYGILNIENNKYDSIILTKTEGYISENPKVSNLIYNYKNDKYMID